MKILKRGTAPSEIPYQATCHKCKTEIEFMEHEARETAGDRPWEPTCLIISCPVCNNGVFVTKH